MFMPNLINQNLMDDFWGFPTVERYIKKNEISGMMQTDIKETEKGFDVTMNLPGYNKDDVKGELKDGCLIVSAVTNKENEEKDSKGKYIRKERYTGSCSRSFYVGKHVTQEDIKAKFENGTLKFTIPKKEEKPAVDESKFIAIE